MKLYHFIPTWINPIGNPWKYPPLDSPEKILPTPIHTILRHLFFSLRRARRGVYDVKALFHACLKIPVGLFLVAVKRIAFIRAIRYHFTAS